MPLRPSIPASSAASGALAGFTRTVLELMKLAHGAAQGSLSGQIGRQPDAPHAERAQPQRASLVYSICDRRRLDSTFL